ncbi:MAG: hypothetical protein OXU96_08640 [Gammaproteobacteria bacterium]|nr:hypothetical protein [Gammaproteobacteria bacterium]
MDITPIRYIDTLAAFKDFTKIFGEAKADALATAIGAVQSEPETAPRAIADLQRAGFTRPQAEEVARQTIVAATGQKPSAELFARCGIAPQPAA